MCQCVAAVSIHLIFVSADRDAEMKDRRTEIWLERLQLQSTFHSSAAITALYS